MAFHDKLIIVACNAIPVSRGSQNCVPDSRSANKRLMKSCIGKLDINPYIRLSDVKPHTVKALLSPIFNKPLSLRSPLLWKNIFLGHGNTPRLDNMHQIQNYLCILEIYRILILSKEPMRKKLVCKMFQDYQLTPVISKKIRIL